MIFQAKKIKNDDEGSQSKSRPVFFALLMLFAVENVLGLVEGSP